MDPWPGPQPLKGRSVSGTTKFNKVLFFFIAVPNSSDLQNRGICVRKVSMHKIHDIIHVREGKMAIWSDKGQASLLWAIHCLHVQCNRKACI